MTPDSSGEEADESVEDADAEMAADAPTAENAATDAQEHPATDAQEEVPNPTGEVILAKPPHSALVGLMAEPVSRSIPVRRSTVLMLVGFIGFGTLMYLYPPATKTVTTITTNSPDGIIPGLIPATTTTTHPPTPTTETTVPSTPTTSTTRPFTTSTTSTVGSSASTTTAPSTTTTTTTTTGSSTTTTRVGVSNTSTTTTTSTTTSP